MVSAVAKVNLAQPTVDSHLLKAGFFADFSLGRLARFFPGLNVSLRYCPTILGVLHKQNLNLILWSVAPKNYAAGCSFPDYLIDYRPSFKSELLYALNWFRPFHDFLALGTF